jgi:hypothetical protein
MGLLARDHAVAHRDGEAAEGSESTGCARPCRCHRK